MKTRRPLFSCMSAVALLTAGLVLATPQPAHGQFLKKLKDTAKTAVEEETLNQVELMVRDKVQCVFDDLECIAGAEDSGEEYVLTDSAGGILIDEEGLPVSDVNRASEMLGGGAPPDLSTMNTGADPNPDGQDANFDFEPGDLVLFEDDYVNDNVGDFPHRMSFKNGNWDVVEWNGQRWLRNTGPSLASLEIPLSETLPEKFTIEFEAYFPHSDQQLIVATAAPSDGDGWRSIPGNAFQIGVAQGTGVVALAGATTQSITASTEVGEGPVPIRITVDGRSAKVFVGTRRVANIPNAEFMRTDLIHVENTYFASEDSPMLIGAIRIASPGRDDPTLE